MCMNETGIVRLSDGLTMAHWIYFSFFFNRRIDWIRMNGSLSFSLFALFFVFYVIWQHSKTTAAPICGTLAVRALAKLAEPSETNYSIRIRHVQLADSRSKRFYDNSVCVRFFSLWLFQLNFYVMLNTDCLANSFWLLHTPKCSSNLY